VKGVTYTYLKSSITQYTKSVRKAGTCSLQAVPRLLTLWMAFTALADRDRGEKQALKRTSSQIGRALSSLGDLPCCDAVRLRDRVDL
jgi:hypothetical protein